MDSPKNIYHICTEKSWNSQWESNDYVTDSLETEGFIHASTQSQVPIVLKRYYTGVKNLLVLSITVKKVVPKVIYEEAPTGGMYPHIYGPLNKNAINDVQKIEN